MIQLFQAMQLFSEKCQFNLYRDLNFSDFRHPLQSQLVSIIKGLLIPSVSVSIVLAYIVTFWKGRGIDERHNIRCQILFIFHVN